MAHVLGNHRKTPKANASGVLSTKVADYIIDIGPDGGDRGGKVIATGTPEQISKSKVSYTGQYLKKVLGE